MDKNIFKKNVEKLVNHYNAGNINYVIKQTEVLLNNFQKYFFDKSNWFLLYENWKF